MKYALLLALLWTLPVVAQTPFPVDTSDSANPQVPALDTLASDTLHIDTAGSPVKASDTILFVPRPTKGEVPVTDTINLEEKLKQNPTTALFKSLLVPGWGQIGNGSIAKAAVVIGLDAWFTGAIIHYGRQANEDRRNYEAATDKQLRNDWYGLYQDRKQERTKYVFFLGVTTLVSIFDAYVDAHLSGSPMDHKEQQLGLDVGPSAEFGWQASLTFRF